MLCAPKAIVICHHTSGFGGGRLLVHPTTTAAAAASCSGQQGFFAEDVAEGEQRNLNLPRLLGPARAAAATAAPAATIPACNAVAGCRLAAVSRHLNAI